MKKVQKMKKAQKTLDYFLIMEAKKKQFFFIDWTVQMPFATWLYQLDKNKQRSFKAIVKWKTIGDIIISCIDDSNEPVYQSTMIPSKEDNKTMISFLKSHLQKSIRRQKLSQALSTSLQLIAINANEFLRRICIIMFEDVHLQFFATNLVWLTSAVSKGYQIKKNQINLLLSYVTLLVNDNQILSLPFQSKEERKTMSYYLDLVEKNKQLSDKQKDILYCLLFRIAYGGMEGDIEMLLSNVVYYHEQFTNGFELEENEMCEDLYDKTPLIMNEGEYIIEGIDFHCFPFIIKKLKEDIGEDKYTTEELQKCIWEYNSKINARCDNKVKNPKLGVIWNDIKASLRKHQHNILTSTIRKQTNKLFNEN